MKSRFFHHGLQAVLWFSQTVTTITRRFFKDNLTYTAGTLTYTTILSLVPITVIAVMILSTVPQFRAAITDVESFFIQNFVPEVGDVIRIHVNQFVGQATRLPVAGLVFLFVLVVLMLLMVERTFNAIWRVPNRRRGWEALVRYILIVVCAPILIAASLAATSYLISSPFLDHLGVGVRVNRALVLMVPFLLSLIAFTVLYVILPNCDVPLRFAFSGALFTAIILELAKKLFVFYVTTFPTYRILYGALATIPIFLLWVFIAWLIILIGALISHTLTVQSFQRRNPLDLSAFSTVLLWFHHLDKNKARKKGVSFVQLYALCGDNCLIPPELLLQLLVGAKFVRVIKNSRVILACEVAELKLNDLYARLPWKFSSTGAETVSHAFCALNREVNAFLMQQLDRPVTTLFSK